MALGLRTRSDLWGSVVVVGMDLSAVWLRFCKRKLCFKANFDFWFPEVTRREEVGSQTVVTQHLKVSYGMIQSCATGLCWNTSKQCYHSHRTGMK